MANTTAVQKYNGLKHCGSCIHDGATIQLGIGGMPNALGTIICETDLKNLGGHTEMLGEA